MNFIRINKEINKILYLRTKFITNVLGFTKKSIFYALLIFYLAMNIIIYISDININKIIFVIDIYLIFSFSISLELLLLNKNSKKKYLTYRNTISFNSKISYLLVLIYILEIYSKINKLNAKKYLYFLYRYSDNKKISLAVNDYKYLSELKGNFILLFFNQYIKQICIIFSIS